MKNALKFAVAVTLLFCVTFATAQPAQAKEDGRPLDTGSKEGTVISREDRTLGIPIIHTEDNKKSLTVLDMGSLRLVSRITLEVDDRRRISISPDGKYMAFQLYQGDLRTNSYHIGWFVAPTKPGAVAINVGDGGDVHLRPSGAHDSVILGDVVAMSSAKWSPDGRWIAYLRMNNGEVQLWRSRVDGKKREQLTHNAADVREAYWSAEGTKLFFTVDRETRSVLRQIRESEARNGFLLDDHYFFGQGDYPLRPLPHETDAWVYDVSRATSRLLSPKERETFETIKDENSFRPVGTLKQRLEQLPQDAILASPVRFKGGSNMVAFASLNEPRDRAYFPTATVSVLSAENPDKPTVCAAVACKGIIFSIWWSDDGHEVYFERRDDNLANDGFFAWSWRKGTVREVMKTQASIEDCAYSLDRLICVYQHTTEPDRIISLSLSDGSTTVLVDPNPELRNINFTEVERLDWTSEIGDGTPADKAFGYLIKPRGYKIGQRYPLVILTKEAHGFLFSGGEYPAHVFADKGMMVFVCQEPFSSLFTFGDTGRFKNDFQVRRHTLVSLEAGIEILEKRGLIDPTRIGLTGFSDGTELTYFALYRSKRIFAASIQSSPDWEPISYYLLPRSLRSGGYLEIGVTLTKDGPSPWFFDGISPSRNVDKIHTPILQNIADSELSSALQTMVTMEEFGKPFEGYVFVDEWHEKWQPMHLYQIRRRNVQWMQFWLQGIEVGDPVDSGQYVRWRKLKELYESDLKGAHSQHPNESPN